MYANRSGFARLFELLTGRSWTTTRSATTEFGPTLGRRYAAELARYSDLELIRYDRDALLATIRADRTSKAVQVDRTQTRTGAAR